MKREYPDCTFILNGGLDEHAPYNQIMQKVNGVMIGRAIYQSPEFLGKLSQSIHNCAPYNLESIISKVHRYAINQIGEKVPLKAITRHLLGLFHGQKGARTWRRQLSNPDLLRANDPDLIMRTYQDVFCS